MSRIAVFSNADNVPDRQQVAALRDASSQMGVAVTPIDVRSASDFAAAFEGAQAQRADQPTMDAEDRGPREGALMSHGILKGARLLRAGEVIQ